MKLWGRVSSVNVQKALWALAELELDFERIDAGMAFGLVDTPEFRAKNPNGKVPVLEDGDFVLWESNVIVRYLCRRYGDGRLRPSDPQQEAHAEQWMDWQAATFGPAMGPAFLGLVRTPEEKRDLAAIDRSIAACEDCLGMLDRWLEGRAYMIGDAFGMADIPLGAIVARWKKLPIERRLTPNVDRWFERIAERPAFRAQVDHPLS